MCEASKAAKTSADAVQGVVYAIGQVSLDGAQGTVGALYAVGSKASDCIFCIKTGQKMALSNIPLALQRMYAIGETAIATFQEAKSWHRDDVLDFGHGKRFHFRCFADCGIEALIGERLVNTDKAVARLLANAAAGRPSSPVGEVITISN